MRKSIASWKGSLILLSACAQSAWGGYNHPGIFNSQEELDYIKATVNASAANPMKQGLAKLNTYSGASLNFQTNPVATVQVVASGVGPGEQSFRDAGHAAYAHALLWVVTGDAKHKDKSLQIINGWAAAFKGMSLLDNHQQDLEAAWAIPTWAAAGEILRYYNHGAAAWAKTDIDKFSAMLDIMCGYAQYTMDVRKMTNNWGTSSALALMAVGVFEDDSLKFNKGMDYLDFILPYTVEKTGLVMETCRDCNHAEYNLLGMMAAAEIAWKQGIDFYGRKLDGQATPRLLMGMEFHAASFLGKPLNVGQTCGPQSCAGEDKHAGGWEMGLNHYRYRANLPIPTTTTFVTTQNRPDGLSEDHFTGWTSLTHAELGDIHSVTAVLPRKAVFRDGPQVSVSRNGGEVTLRYRIADVSGPVKPSVLEVFATDGRKLFSSPLAEAAGEIRIPRETAVAMGSGPLLFRMAP